MAYKVRKQGEVYVVYLVETGEVHSRNPSRATAEARANTLNRPTKEMVKVVPDKKTTLSDGTKVNIYYKGRKRGKTE